MRNQERDERGRRRWSVALFAAVVAVGACQRSDLLETASLDCGLGTRVVVTESPLCVYAPEASPEACPEPVPILRRDGEGWTYCALDAELPAVVLGAARAAAIQATRDAGPPDALVGNAAGGAGGFGGAPGGSGGGLGGNGGYAAGPPDYSVELDAWATPPTDLGADFGPMPADQGR